jgi:hypothetical protein
VGACGKWGRGGLLEGVRSGVGSGVGIGVGSGVGRAGSGQGAGGESGVVGGWAPWWGLLGGLLGREGGGCRGEGQGGGRRGGGVPVRCAYDTPIRQDDMQEAPPSKQNETSREPRLLYVHESRAHEPTPPLAEIGRRNLGRKSPPGAILNLGVSHHIIQIQTPTDLRGGLTCGLTTSQSPCRGRVPGRRAQKINQPPPHRTSGLR